MNISKLLKKETVAVGPRIKIRRFRASDKEAVYCWASDPRVPKFMTWKAHHSVTQTEIFLSHCATQYSKENLAPWAVALLHNDESIGACNFIGSSKTEATAEIAFCLNFNFHGKGLASEAITVLLHEAFAVGCKTVTATVEEDNKSSIRTLSRLGFLKTGARKDQAIDDKNVYPSPLIFSINLNHFHPAR